MMFRDYRQVMLSAVGALALSAVAVGAAVGPAEPAGAGYTVGAAAVIEARTAAGGAGA